MNTIIYTIIVAIVIAFLLGVLLGLFKKIFHVDTDPKVQKVRDALSGANCGGCGFAGCDAFAGAVVKDEAPTDGCVAGGSSCATSIAEILGKAGVEVKPKVAFLACNGTKECAQPKADYVGIQTCAAAQLTMNGTKKCAFGCIGLGDCVKACPFGAATMGEDGLPKIDSSLCVACGKCAKACPKHLFHIMNLDTKGPVARCSTKSDNKPQIKKDCASGCFKCGMCARKCPEQAIDVSGGLPVINYEKCVSCNLCVSACPDKVLVMFQDLYK
ncbi:MAG: RnfABCDGE type electron transport complex subunit B [Treponema sp.]|nr:RnfABCDGE type electron transport complex subunit B [Treponema sp.]